MKHEIVLMQCDKLNEYIKGRISGIIYALSGKPEQGYGWRKDVYDGDEVLTFECTDEQFKEIEETIDKLYGSLIVYMMN